MRRFQLNSAITEAKLSNVNVEEGTEEAAVTSVNADIERLLFEGKLDEVHFHLNWASSPSNVPEPSLAL